jgi:hypothetical protein
MNVALQLNCGTGAGGFHGGNTCAKGGATGRATYPDKRLVPKPGEKVRQVTSGGFGSAAVLHGTVLEGRAGKLRVRIDSKAGGIGAADIGKSFPLTPEWSVVGDPVIEAAHQARAAKEAAKATEKAAADADFKSQLAKDESLAAENVAKNGALHAHKLTAGQRLEDVRTGDKATVEYAADEPGGYAGIKRDGEHYGEGVGDADLRFYRSLDKPGIKASRDTTMNAQPTVLVLRAATAPFKDAVVMGQGLPMEKDGVPVRYRWKESLPLGQYRDKDGKPFEITPARVENLVRNFNRAKAKGFTPPIIDQHEKRGAASYGSIVDARKGGNGSLELLHQFVGEDAILASARNKTSICTVGNVTDETGEVFDELIDHQALIPDPQLNNLSDFTPALAASRGQSQPAVFLELAASEQESPMDISKLRDALGAAKELPDADVIAQAALKLTETVPALELSRTQGATIATLTQERDAAKTALAAAQQPPMPEALASGYVDLASKQIDLCLSQGRCTKVQADLAKEALKDGDKPAVLMLGKSGPKGSPVDVILKILELNKSMAGTISGGQALPDPNDPNAPKPVSAERKKELLAHAGL